MKNVLMALAVLLLLSLAATAGETVVPKGIHNAPGHMDANVVKTPLQPIVTGTTDRLTTKEGEYELLLRRLNFCSDACRRAVARFFPASAENGEFARGSVD